MSGQDMTHQEFLRRLSDATKAATDAADHIERLEAEIEQLKAAASLVRDKAQSVAQYLRTSIKDGETHGAVYWSDALDIGASMLEKSLRHIDGEAV